MAIIHGLGPLSWAINGILCLEGEVTLQASKQASSFYCVVPMDEPGALSLAAGGDATITVQCEAGAGTFSGFTIDRVQVCLVQTVIKVEGRDEMGKLFAGKSADTFPNQQTDQVVSQLAGEAGLGGGNISGSGAMAGKQIGQQFTRITDNISYGMAIHKTSELDGAHYFMQDGQFTYTSQDAPQGGTYSLFYKYPSAGSPMVSDCLDLIVEINCQASGDVNVNSYKQDEAQVNKGQASAGSGGGGNNSWNFHIPNLTQDQANQIAQNIAQSIQRQQITIYATVVGDPSIKAGMGLSVSGTGIGDGSYIIDTAEHQFEHKDGYVTRITARLSLGGGS